MVLSAELLTELSLGLTTIGILCGIAKRQGSIDTKLDTLVDGHKDHETRLRVVEKRPEHDPKPIRQHAI